MSYCFNLGLKGHFSPVKPDKKSRTPAFLLPFWHDYSKNQRAAAILLVNEGGARKPGIDYIAANETRTYEVYTDQSDAFRALAQEISAPHELANDFQAERMASTPLLRIIVKVPTLSLQRLTDASSILAVRPLNDPLQQNIALKIIAMSRSPA